jgi:DNA (cytosine-5)-methyltransferase 1
MSHVDSTSPVTHVSLCAGYGGIDLGLHRAIRNLRTIAVSEIEAFACANLVAKMEAGLLDCAPIWTDLKTFPWAEFRDRVDILSGGYPCQPFSAAGKRLGAEDPRHLWPHISAGIAAMRPSCCFFENVEGHISLGLSDVIEDLDRLGYRATWCVASASECGAPHQRKRIFILAHDSSAGLQGNFAQLLNAQGREKPRRSTGGCGGLGGEIDLANANGARGWEDWQSSQSWPTRIEQPSGDSRASQPREIREGQAWPSRPGERQFWWEPPRVVDTASARQQAQRDESNGQWREGLAGESGELGNAPVARRAQHCAGLNKSQDDSGAAHRNECERQTQSPLGRDADGPADWLDDAELYTTCDNRTDELRLLGNGVVPACAERAFRLLVGELANARCQ